LIIEKVGSNYLFRFASLSRIHGLTHAVVSRSGGSSRRPYNGCNVSLGVGDNAEAALANRERLRQITGGVHVYTRQNHGTAIAEVTRQSLTPGASIVTAPQAADALISDVPGVRLLIQTADCQAVMLVDGDARVVANVHCGWRGSVADIVARTVARMVSRFDCHPARMMAAIGPSLGPCCAEFINYEKEIPRRLWPFRVGRHHFDFWRISRHQLTSAGLPDSQIYGSGICTRCNPHLFFSYRADRDTGRFAALIGLDAAEEDRQS
jgi:hypothetical protein